MNRRGFFVAFAASLTFLMGCNGNRVAIEGSGVIERDDRSVETFRSVRMSCSAELIITKGTREELIIEADDNLLELITTKSNGNELRIETKKPFELQPSKPIRILLTVNTLESISVSGSGSIQSDELVADKLSITISGSAKVIMDNLDAKEVKLKISGSSESSLHGQVNKLQYQVSGSGKLKAYELKADNVDISITGSGNAEVFAEKSLNVKVTGSGHVKYQGQPSNVTQSVTGSGSVTAAN